MIGCGSTNIAIAPPESAQIESTEVATTVSKDLAPEIITEPAKTIKRNLAVKTTPVTVAGPIPNEIVVAAEIPVPSVAPVIAKPQSNWTPNEVHLIRGNELISGLQRDIGRKPTQVEMQQRLQTHMGLSAPQAERVIATLGLQ